MLFKKFLFIITVFSCISSSLAIADMATSTSICSFYLNVVDPSEIKSIEISLLQSSIASLLKGVSVEINPNEFPTRINKLELIEYFKINAHHLNFIFRSLNIKVLKLGKQRFSRLLLSHYPTDSDLRSVNIQIRSLPIIDHIPWFKNYSLDSLHLDGQFLELDDLVFFRSIESKNI